MATDQLSPHFRLAEFAVSAGHPELVVAPPGHVVTRLRELCVSVLEPLRMAFALPIRVLSGYRSARLNAASGGSSTSQHMLGEAADLTPVADVPAVVLFELLRSRAARGRPLPHGQVIYYPEQNFVHVALPGVRFPHPTFCVHWPARHLHYHVVTPTESLASLTA